MIHLRELFINEFSMDQKFLKRLISECPLTDFSENGNVTERQLQLGKYLEQFTDFLYSNENQLIQNISGKNILHLQKSHCSRIQKGSEGVLFSWIVLLQFITIRQEKAKVKRTLKLLNMFLFSFKMI